MHFCCSVFVRLSYMFPSTVLGISAWYSERTTFLCHTNTNIYTYTHLNIYIYALEYIESLLYPIPHQKIHTTEEHIDISHRHIASHRHITSHHITSKHTTSNHITSHRTATNSVHKSDAIEGK